MENGGKFLLVVIIVLVVLVNLSYSRCNQLMARPPFLRHSGEVLTVYKQNWLRKPAGRDLTNREQQTLREQSAFRKALTRQMHQAENPFQREQMTNWNNTIGMQYRSIGEERAMAKLYDMGLHEKSLLP